MTDEAREGDVQLKRPDDAPQDAPAPDRAAPEDSDAGAQGAQSETQPSGAANPGAANPAESNPPSAGGETPSSGPDAAETSGAAGEPAGESQAEAQSADAEQPAEASRDHQQEQTDSPDEAAAAASGEPISADQAEGAGGEVRAAEEATDEEEEEQIADAEPLEMVAEAGSEEEMEFNWYILKVASNRENSIADALRRRVKVEGLESYFGDIIVPTEDVAEYKNGKKRIVKRKLYPGYICVNMHINDDTWFLVRETPGIGDFTGAAGKPSPMLDHEIERILPKPEGEEQEKPKVGIPFKMGDRVRIKEGTFENFEGDVDGIDEANGRVTVVINIFDRPTPVEIDHWQLESV